MCSCSGHIVNLLIALLSRARALPSLTLRMIAVWLRCGLRHESTDPIGLA